MTAPRQADSGVGEPLPLGCDFMPMPRPGSRPSGHEFLLLEAPGRTLTKYVFIQDDAQYLPRILDKYLREYADSTAGIHVQPNSLGGRTLWRTALDLYRIYGFRYFQRKARHLLWNKLCARAGHLVGRGAGMSTVAGVARKYGVPVHHADDVNAEAFRRQLSELGVEFIISISGTQLYRRALREQTPYGIVNCHGALLPRYRGLMPSFWTLANGEAEGGTSVHFVDSKLDNGPIVVQRRYRLLPHDTLENVVSRSKDLAAEAIIDAVRIVESGRVELIPNDAAAGSSFSMPTAADVARFKATGHRFG